MALVFHYCFVEPGAVTDPDRGGFRLCPSVSLSGLGGGGGEGGGGREGGPYSGAQTGRR